ncbi:MAG: ABC transporter permease [Myxococcota bacterium]|nr:ABC transporter permease [Myxococcota bacterium]
MSLKYAVIWPLARLKAAPFVSAMCASAVAIAAFLVIALTSFVEQVETAVETEIQGLGYDFLITARGCPYEAATLMLRGGVGMRYMPEGVRARAEQDEAISKSFAVLLHPVRDSSSESGMVILRGMEEEAFAARGLSFVSGEAFGDEEWGVVLGFEAAELDQRTVGSTFLLPGTLEVEPKEIPVVGILERSGTQVDGSVLLPIVPMQEHFRLSGKLTGIGVQLSPEGRANEEEFTQRYEENPELQVVRLSAVAARLRSSTDDLSKLTLSLSSAIVGIALLLLLSVGVIRSASSQQQVHVLHASGVPSGFLVVSTAMETLLVVGVGVVLGAILAALAGSHLVSSLDGTLPFVPETLNLGLDRQGALKALGLLVGTSVLSALPQWWTLQKSSPVDLRRS